METLANLEAFARSAEFGSFSEAARRLSLTPAAVSRNVAILERNLGVRLFHRSTRKLTLTEAGEAFRTALGQSLDEVQAAVASAKEGSGKPIGTLKVSLPPTLGIAHILPLLPGFLVEYPGIKPEWHFENRPVDLISEGYDAAIGGGFELSPNIVARTLAPAHIIAVASPAYLSEREPPSDPSGLRMLDGIVMRSLQTGRVRHWTMQNHSGRQVPAELAETIIVNDPAAMREMALLGLGMAMIAVPDVQIDLESGRLVRLVPRWWSDAGSISLYYPSRTLVPHKTKVFVDWILDSFKERGLAARFSARER